MEDRIADLIPTFHKVNQRRDYFDSRRHLHVFAHIKLLFSLHAPIFSFSNHILNVGDTYN